MNPSRTVLESSEHGPIMLRPAGVDIVLRPTDDSAGVPPGVTIHRALVSGRLLLLLCDLRAAETPETLFHVYLNLPKKGNQATHAKYFLAQFNFFTAGRPGDTSIPVWQSIDVTHAVGTLAAQGTLETETTLTILAARPFDPESRPSVGRLAIVQQ
ncbi:MAG: hypothetical protein QM706_01390 [Nitrospira sp.]